MPDLLTSNDWLEIRSAIKDVTDTFLKKPVIFIQRKQRKLVAFHENRAQDLSQTSYILNTLVVPNSTDGDRSQAKEELKGMLDNSQGYLLFSYVDLKNHTPSLIQSDGKPVFAENKDSFYFDGREVSIIGINTVANTESDFQLVKVHYKNQLSVSDLIPINTSFPAVSGTGTVGQILNTTNGSWIGTQPVAYSYQWKRNGVNISGATASTYTLVLADAGASISCQVTASNSLGSLSVVGNQINVS
jgi:hypothetical protein